MLGSSSVFIALFWASDLYNLVGTIVKETEKSVLYFLRCPTSLPSRKVSDESLGRDETSFCQLYGQNNLIKFLFDDHKTVENYWYLKISFKTFSCLLLIRVNSKSLKLFFKNV